MQRLIEYLSTWLVEEPGDNVALNEKESDMKATKFKSSIAHRKALGLLKDKCGSKGLIRYPDVFHLLSWYLHLSKKESRIFLKELEQVGFISIVPYHGVMLKDN